jgi:hypothetical protein
MPYFGYNYTPLAYFMRHAAHPEQSLRGMGICDDRLHQAMYAIGHVIYNLLSLCSQYDLF